jgi:hypothetical protein
MKTLFLLITLTQNGAGDINASFVNSETLAQCQQKAQMVESVFTASAIPVIESRCIKSKLQFSEFGHASNASKIRNFYLLTVNEKTIQVSAMPDWRSCMTAQRNASAASRVYCGSSVQSIQ